MFYSKYKSSKKPSLIRKKYPLFKDFTAPKMGNFAIFAFLRGIFQLFMKNCLIESKFNLSKREEWYGNSSIRIKLFCFKKAYFCNFTKFLVVVLTQPTCPFHLYCTSYNTSDIDGNVAEWYRCWTVPLHVHRVFVIRREKEGDLTQSYDKTPYTNRKFENQRTTHKRHQKLRLHNDCVPT